MRVRVICLVGLALITAAACAQPPGAQDGYYSVLSFGAKGDGTTDDTSAFQKAVDAASSRGGYVTVPPVGPGKGYVITGTVRLPKGVSVIGCPAGFGNNAWAAFDLPEKQVSGVKVFARPRESDYRGPKKQPLFRLEGGNTVRGLWILYDRQPWPTDQEFKDPKSPYYYESFEKAKAGFVNDHVKPCGPTLYLAPGAVNVVIEDIICDRYYDFYFQASGGKNVVSRVYLYGYRRGFVIRESFDVNRISDIHLCPNVGPACPGKIPGGKDYSWVYGVVVSDPDCVGMHVAKSDGYFFRDLFFYGVHTGVRLGASTAYPLYDPIEGVQYTPKPAGGPWGSISTFSADCCNIGMHFVWPTTMTMCMLTNAYIATTFDDGSEFPPGGNARVARQGAFVVEPTCCVGNDIGIVPTFLCSNAQISSFGGLAGEFAASSASSKECNGRVFLINGDVAMEMSNLQINAPYNSDLLYAAGDRANRYSIRIRGLNETGEMKPDLLINSKGLNWQ